MTRQEIEQLDEALHEMELTYHEQTLFMREEYEAARDNCEYLGHGMYRRGRNPISDLL